MAEPTNDLIITLLSEQFGDKILKTEIVNEQLQVEIRGANVLDVLGFLKNDERCDFSYLVDVGGVDYLKMPERPERFGINYIVQNMNNFLRVVVRAYVSEEDPEVETLSSLFGGANWLEREIYDLFGIYFKNHPDLRRILMPDDYDGHPLRKDYPLQGRGERENFPRYEYYEPSKK